MSDIQSQLPVKITDGTNTVVVTGAAALKVDNSAVTQPVSGSVSVLNFPNSQTVSVSNFPATQAVAVSNFPATQPVSGTVSVSNLPTTQPVSGTVSVSNFPATQPVSGTVSTTAGEISTGVVAAYGSATAVGLGSNASITYTVTTGKTFYLKQVFAAASGAPCKVVVSTGTGGSLSILAVGFFSASHPNFSMAFAQPIPVSSATVVNVVIYNNAGLAQDVYGGIYGREI